MLPDLKLDHLDFSHFVDERSGQFTGREWAFQAIQDWLAAAAEKNRYFLITGAPGSGKTSIGARLAAFSKGMAEPPPEMTAFQPGFLAAIHFCRSTEARWCDPITFSRSIAWQLARVYPEFSAALEQARDPGRALDVQVQAGTVMPHGTVVGVVLLDSELKSDEAFGRYFRDPVEALMRARPDFRATILVDGIDESLGFEGRTGISALLARMEQLSPNLRFILTSRENTDIKLMFHGAALELSSPDHLSANAYDLKRYVDARLSLMQIPGSEALSEDLAARSNFLYVRLALDFIQKQGLSAYIPGSLPAGMDELILEWVRRTLRIHERDWTTDYAPVLGALLVAHAVLSIAQIARFSGLRESRARRSLSELGFLLERHGDEYSIYHQLLSEFLQGEQICGETGQAVNPYYIPASEHHEAIALSYKRGASRWPEVVWSKLDDYGMRYLASHLASWAIAEQDGKEIYEFICHDLLTAKRALYGADASFVSDIRLSIRAAEAQRPPDYDQVIRGSLIIATLNIVAARTPTYAIAALAWAGEVGRALDLAAVRRNPADLVHCAEALIGQGDHAAARRVVNSAIDLGRRKNDRDILTEIVELLFSMGDKQASAEVAAQLLDGQDSAYDWANAFSAITEVCVRTGDMKPIERSLRNYKPGSGYRAKLLADIADTLWAAGRLDSARRTIGRAIWRARRGGVYEGSWWSIAVTLARMGRHQDALRIAGSLESSDCKARVLAEIGPIEDAFARARKPKNDRLFRFAIVAALRSGALDQAIAEAKLQKADHETWAAISREASKRELWREALDAIAEMPHDILRSGCWEPIGRALGLAEAASFARGAAALEEALEHSSWRWEREDILAILAYGYARHGKPQKAIRLATQCIEDATGGIYSPNLVRVLGEIAVCLARHGSREALEVVSEASRAARLGDVPHFQKAARGLAEKARKRVKEALAEPLLPEKTPSMKAAQDGGEIDKPAWSRFLHELLEEDSSFQLQEDGAEIAIKLGANEVIAAISFIVDEYRRSTTLEAITTSLAARGAWTEALSFSLARLKYDTEAVQFNQTYEHLAEDIPIYWAIDEGLTLKKIYRVMKEMDSWWD